MRLRKAQAAMEFLVTYGWAILIVLAAIGALAYFGVLKPGKYLPDSCQFQAGISCVDWKALPGANGTGTVTAVIRNSKGQDFIDFSLSAAGFPCTDDKDTYTNPSATVNLDDGEEAIFVITCPNELISTKKLSVRLKANYKTYTDAGLVEHNIYGDMTTKIE